MLGSKLNIENIFKSKAIIIVIIILSVLFIIMISYFSLTNEITTEQDNSMINESFITSFSSNVSKTIKPLDISILNSNKFKVLKEMDFKEVGIEAGRINPFEDPFEREQEQEQN